MQNSPPPETHPPWLAISTLASAAIFVGFLVLRHDLPFWYDEVFTLGAAGIGSNSMDWPTILRDVHPPTYILLVNVFSQLVEGDTHAIRLVNLAAVPALALSAAILWKQLGGLAFWACTLLLLSSLFVFHFALELRVYGLLLAFALLGHALWLKRLESKGGTTIPLILTALCLTSLHFFGAALGTALLLLAALASLRQGEKASAAAFCFSALVCTGLTLWWAFAVADISRALGGQLWIKNGLQPWATLISGLPLLALTLLFIALYRRKVPTLWPSPNPLWLLAPGAMVVGVALLISFHSPVVSVKNLCVLIPGLALFTVRAAPSAFLTAANATPFTLILAFATTASSAWKAGQPHEYVRWVVETASPPQCEGVPLYVLRPDIVDEYAQQVFLGARIRPLANLPDIKKGFDLTAFEGPCTILGAGWHEPGNTEMVQRFLETNGIPVTISRHPQSEAKGDTRLSPGFVIRLVP